MSLRCAFGLHDFVSMTPDHGFVVNNGFTADNLDQEYDTKEFLHASRCTRCGAVDAFVSLLYFTVHEPKKHRDPTEQEIVTFLRAEVAKTSTTARIKTALKHIDVMA
jgi:hypothetical protein